MADPQRSAAQRRNARRWAIAGGGVVVAGFVAALVTAGGGGSGATSTSSGQLPPGGQMTVVKKAPPPRPGETVLGAGKTRVHDVYYELIISKPRGGGPKHGPVPLYMNEYTGSPLRLLQRFKMPHPFARDSRITGFNVEANPDPNPEKTASVTLTWFLHAGDTASSRRYFELTQHGIQVD